MPVVSRCRLLPLLLLLLLLQHQHQLLLLVLQQQLLLLRRWQQGGGKGNTLWLLVQLAWRSHLLQFMLLWNLELGWWRDAAPDRQPLLRWVLLLLL